MHMSTFLARYCSAVDCAAFFFFQAEDGIRDLTVTGVQTCALDLLQNCYDRAPGRRKTHGLEQAHIAALIDHSFDRSNHRLSLCGAVYLIWVRLKTCATIP